MALRAAVANGNWSNPATWNGGTLPQAGDVVASNNFTVTIDQNITVDTLTNVAVSPVTAVPIMTGYTTPSGIVTFSSEFPGYSAFRVFDGSTSNGWITANTVLTGWVAYEFTTAKIITSYVLAGGASGGNSFPRNWTFEGWDGSNWIVLHTVTGNTNTSTYTGNFTNTTAYIKYRINITLNNGNTSYTGINEMYLYESGTFLTTTTAGGGFILNSGYTLNATLFAGAVALLTYSGTGTSTINGNLNVGTSSTASAVIFNSVSGVLNIVGNVLKSNSGSAATLLITNTGTVNIVGDVTITFNNSSMNTISMTAAATLNITGNIYTSAAYAYFITSLIATFAGCTLNVTGNVTHNSSNSTNANCITVGTNVNVNITGTVSGGDFGTPAINNSGGFLRVVGSVISKVAGAGPAIISDSASVINLMSGPFISSSYGFSPLRIVRMHLIPSVTSYFEFRDETTNGAVSPGPIAPAARLVQPGYAVDAPVPANVRTGVVYASGTQTGTLAMPAAGSVAFGVPVDNTTGTALLSPADVWTAATSAMTTAGSIGERLKNASTVDTTGDQLAALL